MSIQDEQWYNFLSKCVTDTNSGGGGGGKI